MMILGSLGSSKIIPPSSIPHLVTFSKSLPFRHVREEVLGIECGKLWEALFCLPNRHPNIKAKPRREGALSEEAWRLLGVVKCGYLERALLAFLSWCFLFLCLANFLCFSFRSLNSLPPTHTLMRMLFLSFFFFLFVIY